MIKKDKRAYGGTPMKIQTPDEVIYNSYTNLADAEYQGLKGAEPYEQGLAALNFVTSAMGNFKGLGSKNIDIEGIKGTPLQNNYTVEDFSEYNKNNKVHKLKTITAGLNNQPIFNPSVKPHYFALGGEVPIEAEGEEIVQEPNGNMYELNGASHEEGGIDMTVPQGTQIYSKRLKGADGKTMAERKAFREKQLAKLKRLLERNPNDKTLKRTLSKTENDFAKQEAEDLEYMNYMHQQSTMEQPQEEFKTGGYATDDPIIPSRKLNKLIKSRTPIQLTTPENYSTDINISKNLLTLGNKPVNPPYVAPTDEEVFNMNDTTYNNIPNIYNVRAIVPGENLNFNYSKPQTIKAKSKPSISNIQTGPHSNGNNNYISNVQLAPHSNGADNLPTPVNLSNVTYNKPNVKANKPNSTTNTNSTTARTPISTLGSVNPNPQLVDTYSNIGNSILEATRYRNEATRETTGNNNDVTNSNGNSTRNNSNVNTSSVSSERGINKLFKDLEFPMTLGDAVDLYGKYRVAYDPAEMTLRNRSGDTPNINAYENYGKRGINQLEKTKDFLEYNLGQAIQNNELNTNSYKSNNSNNARSINTLNALNMAADAQQMAADNQAYMQYGNQIASIDGQLANMMNQQDQMVMQGEQNRDDADRRDRDNFNMQLQKDINTKNKGIQEIGKDINNILEREGNLQAINNMYPDFSMSRNGTLKAKGDPSTWTGETKYWNGKPAAEYQRFLKKKDEGYFFDNETQAIYNKDGKEVDKSYNVIPNGRVVDLKAKNTAENENRVKVLKELSDKLGGKTDYDKLSEDEQMEVYNALVSGKKFYKGGVYWKALNDTAKEQNRNYRSYINPLTGKRFTSEKEFADYKEQNNNDISGLQLNESGFSYSRYEPKDSFNGISQIKGYFGNKDDKGKDVKSTYDIDVKQINDELDNLSETFEDFKESQYNKDVNYSDDTTMDIENLNNATLDFFSKLGAINYGYDARKVFNGNKIKGYKTKSQLLDEYKNQILYYLSKRGK